MSWYYLKTLRNMTALDQAKATRDDLKAKLANVAAKQAVAAGPVATLQREEDAARAISHQAAVSKWLAEGGHGLKPKLEDIAPEHSPRVIAARHAVASAQPELQRLAEIHDVLRVQHDAAQADVTSAAAQHMTDRFTDLGAHVRELRSEIKEIEEVLAAGAHYFAEVSDTHYARTRTRNSALADARNAALASLADLSPEMIRAGFSLETPGLSPAIPTRSAIAVHREQFEALQR